MVLTGMYPNRKYFVTCLSITGYIDYTNRFFTLSTFSIPSFTDSFSSSSFFSFFSLSSFRLLEPYCYINLGWAPFVWISSSITFAGEELFRLEHNICLLDFKISPGLGLQFSSKFLVAWLFAPILIFALGSLWVDDIAAGWLRLTIFGWASSVEQLSPAQVTHSEDNTTIFLSLSIL